MKLHQISPAATLSQHQHTAIIDQALIDQKAQDARESDRKRNIHVLHTGDEDTLQRMLNAFQPGTYVAPHRHVAVPKAESALVIQGSLGFVRFSDDGTYQAKDFVYMNPKEGTFGVDYRAGVWHTFIALEPDTVVLEVKPGPYDVLTDKEFASWAPKEGDADATEYLAKLEDRFRQHFQLPPRSWNE
ncbi:MAG: WbuC family cupin fold metalloprotein [Tunicatimonas sp.]|uniref:WbuC family cupin fold metalloprotein n=1 Tax=Tunicatimonas sp. TaxID=1940096 RepID=UPI003C72892C